MQLACKGCMHIHEHMHTYMHIMEHLFDDIHEHMHTYMHIKEHLFDEALQRVAQSRIHLRTRRWRKVLEGAEGESVGWGSPRGNGRV